MSFVFWRILEANNEEQINTRAYTKKIRDNCLFHLLTSSYIMWPILPKIVHFLLPTRFSWQSTQLTKKNYKSNPSGRLITRPERITTWHFLDSKWLGMTGLVTTRSGLRSPELLPLSTLLSSSTTGTAITLDLGEISLCTSDWIHDLALGTTGSLWKSKGGLCSTISGVTISLFALMPLAWSCIKWLACT